MPHLAGACLAVLACLMLPGAPATAQKAPAVIQSVRAVTSRGATLVNIALTGTTTPTLRDEGNSLVVTLPNATAGSGLGNHLASAGLVSGIGLESASDSERIILVLRSPAQGRLLAGPNPQTVQVAVAPEGRLALASVAEPTPRPVHVLRAVSASKPTVPAPRLLAFAPAPEAPLRPREAAILTPAAAAPRVRLYNVNAYQSDLAGVLNSLAQEAHVSIVMAGPVSSKVTMTLRQAPLEKAIDLLTRAAGLSYHQDGAVFMVGDAKDLAAAYPAPVPVMQQTVYRCLHVTAADLVTALQNTFDKDKLRVSIGAAPYSPRLDDATTSDVTGVQASALKSTDSSGGATTGVNSHMVILAGEQSIVAQALALAQQLDVRRAQVKIDVQITDINRTALKNLGLQWNFGSLNFQENQPNGIGFGSFNRSPLAISATISALENSGDAKVLAAPNMSLLDGERGFILIGDRLQYPKLTGYTQAQTPIYDVAEERVGIYLQVAVQIEENGEVTMTIYPQVSTVSGYLNINGASYPQISTREQQTTIRVKDGQQIVVGGLLQEEDIKNVQRVPILSSIPFFRELFTYRNTTKQQSEVVIVITPHILKD